jgi:predicted enzyme related to lactoylglutathione lyase
VTSGMKTVIYPADDLDTAKAFFSALLGVAPDTDEAYYVGYTLDGQHVGLDPNGHRDGPVGYWHVDDIAATVADLVDAGGKESEAPHDVGGGRLVGTVTDAHGNVIGLIQSPW